MAEPKFPPDKLFRYPHMFPRDIPIWDRFLDKYAELYVGFDYDIKVGTGVIVPDEWEDNYKRMAEVLSKYRVDVVGHKSGRLEIIEVKPEASTVAIGQVITYIELYKRDFSPSAAVIGVIVTDREVGDMRELTDRLGFEYYVI